MPALPSAAAPTKVEVAPNRKQKILQQMPLQITAAALISGFSLGRLGKIEPHHDDMEKLLYLFLIMAIHLCTWSLLTSLVIYRRLVMASGDEIAQMEQTRLWWFLFRLPLAKFAIGLVFYLLAVILISVRDTDDTWLHTPMIIIGCASMSTVLLMMGVVGGGFCTPPPPPPPPPEEDIELGVGATPALPPRKHP